MNKYRSKYGALSETPHVVTDHHTNRFKIVRNLKSEIIQMIKRLEYEQRKVQYSILFIGLALQINGRLKFLIYIIKYET